MAEAQVDARRVETPLPGGAARVAGEASAIVVGGGIAGVAAATVLAERGVGVILVEREAYLGGRAGAWNDRLADGSSFEMERGFHAFFRQYYNLRALLRRIDPELSMLTRLEDYPILGPEGQVQSFAGLPRRTPWNIATLTWRTPTLGWKDLRRVNVGRAVQMLAFDAQRNYARWDATSASEYLDSLRFPPHARRLLFDVFAHSFFNPEQEMSAAELLMMFHFYFTGNPEGLVFDVAKSPFSHSLWSPFARHLESLGVTLRRSTSAESLRELPGGGFELGTSTGPIQADRAVLALTVSGLRRLLAASPALGDESWRQRVESLELTLPFAVWRLWLDRPCAEGRTPFVGTTGVGRLDNISLYHLFEDESREWARRTGGSVVELHAYAVEEDLPEEELRADLRAGMEELYPETRGAKVLEERFLLRRDCPAFHRGSDALRPGVETPLEGLTLAGDFVKLPFPSALMERAAASGFLAANGLLADWGVTPEPVYSVAPRGLLARVTT
jgi:isorenieratene synthase